MKRMIVYAAVLDAYLRAHLSGTAASGSRAPLDLSGEMHISECPGGHSNLTFLVRFGREEFILRRPPAGPVAPKAHDIAREYRWLDAIHPLFPLAPRPFLLCEDVSIAGSVFAVLERRHGVVVARDEPAGLASPDARRRVSEAMVDALADLHAIDPAGRPLAGLGRPEGFMARQVAGWLDRWRRSKTEDLPEMESTGQWLLARLPADPVRPSIVHGDFKLDNLMIDPDRQSISAVLDWEMCAIGDPLVDLGILLAYWSATSASGQDGGAVTSRPGWFTREQIVDRYARRTGRDLSPLGFYEAFALFKVAVVIQQIYSRFLDGHTADPRFAGFGERVAYVARRAALLAS